MAQSVSTGKSIEERLRSDNFDSRFDAVLELPNDQNAIAILAQVLDHDSSPAIRALAATKLGQSKSQDAAMPLLATLNNLTKTKKKDDFLQRTIIYALGSFRQPAVVMTLIGQLSDKEPMIRSAAIDSLGKIQDKSAVTALVQSLRDSDSFVRARSAIALGEIKDRQAVTPLVSVLASDQSGEVRREAAKSLGIIGGPEAKRALEAASSDKDPFVRRYSWEALHPKM